VTSRRASQVSSSLLRQLRLDSSATYVPNPPRSTMSSCVLVAERRARAPWLSAETPREQRGSKLLDIKRHHVALVGTCGASNFYFALFQCHSFMEVPNPDLHCDRAIDALAQEAYSAEASDPTRARRLWAEVDRQVTDESPAVFLFSNAQTVAVSARVGTLQSNSVAGPLLSQIWIE
jgi:ABC-type transport system substrate-binding protein